MEPWAIQSRSGEYQQYFKNYKIEHMSFEYLSLARHPGNLPDAAVLNFSLLEGSSARFERFGVNYPASVARALPKRRAEYLAGRRVALQSLREAGVEVNDLGIGPMGAPLWPDGYYGSITHSDNMAAAVAMPASGIYGVGIDLEQVASADTISAIRQVALSPVEELALDSLVSRVGQPTALTIAFSAKESFYKATAAMVGHIFDFGALRITSACADLGVVEARVDEALSPILVPGRTFSMGFSVLSCNVVITSCVCVDTASVWASRW
jgi:enterobactin synthetase component D